MLLGQKSRPDRIAAAYTVLLAGGGVLLGDLCQRVGSRWLSVALPVVLLVSGAALAPLAIPLLPPTVTARYADTLGVVPQIERGEDKRSGLPQWLADRYGWQRDCFAFSLWLPGAETRYSAAACSRTELSGCSPANGETMTHREINLEEKLGKLPADDYAMGIVAKMNNYELKVVRFRGDFVWHSHPDTDETFIILDSTMTMNFRDGIVEVDRGEMIVIPKGVERKPSSVNEYKALLIEPEGVPNTGAVDSDMTIRVPKWI